MINRLQAFSFSALLVFSSIAAADNNWKIVSTRANQDIDVDQLAQDVKDLDVLFLGEEHDNDVCHQQQLAIIEALHATGRPVAIAMEMFERDVQGALNDYLAGRIDEETFKAHSRPWKNYDEHYRPIIEFAKENNMAVIAANVPRSAARNLAKGEANAPDTIYIARSTSAPLDGYYQLFTGAMAGHMGNDNEEAIVRMYEAQCLKDDTMAESIVDFLDQQPHQQPLVVHLCGKFHSDHGYGTAGRVLSRRPLMKISVFTMIRTDNMEEPNDDINRRLADYVLVVENKKEEEKEEEGDQQ